ncbi:hypothetical protein MRX96_015942 [Rhipicephalus microplus]
MSLGRNKTTKLKLHLALPSIFYFSLFCVIFRRSREDVCGIKKILSFLGPFPEDATGRRACFRDFGHGPAMQTTRTDGLIHPTRQDRRADERNCGDTNEPTTDDGAFTIVGIDEKVHDWSDMEDDRFKMDTDEVTWSKEYERLWLKTASARFVG